MRLVLRAMSCQLVGGCCFLALASRGPLLEPRNWAGNRARQGEPERFGFTLAGSFSDPECGIGFGAACQSQKQARRWQLCEPVARFSLRSTFEEVFVLGLEHSLALSCDAGGPRSSSKGAQSCCPSLCKFRDFARPLALAGESSLQARLRRSFLGNGML